MTFKLQKGTPFATNSVKIFNVVDEIMRFEACKVQSANIGEHVKNRKKSRPPVRGLCRNQCRKLVHGKV